jgi:hypothetical protein
MVTALIIEILHKGRMAGRRAKQHGLNVFPQGKNRFTLMNLENQSPVLLREMLSSQNGT